MVFEKEKEELIQNLVRWEYAKKPEVIGAFKKVPRHEFVPADVRKYSYLDQPLPIGYGQTISAPSMIAIMLEVLDLKPGQKVLEIGTGSGYNAALIAELVGPRGKVFTIERIAELADFGRSNLEAGGYKNVRVIIGDGTCGYEKEAPWDRVLVTACASEPPGPLIEQLKIGGKLAVPVGSHYMFQILQLIEKKGEDKTEVRKCGGCSFVPSIGKHGWKEG